MDIALSKPRRGVWTALARPLMCLFPLNSVVMVMFSTIIAKLNQLYLTKSNNWYMTFIEYAKTQRIV